MTDKEWIDEKPTMELRFRLYRVLKGPNPFDIGIERRLQQKWKITRGGGGDGVKYEEVWRDVVEVGETL